MSSEPVDSIKPLLRDLKRRWNAPKRSVTFYKHLIVGVLVGGGAGIWFTLCKKGMDTPEVAAALLTYFPPLVAAGVIEFTQERQPYLQSFGLIAAAFFLMLFLVAVFVPPAFQLLLALASAILSVLLWWVAVGEKDWVRDIRAEAATGGDVNQPLLKSDETNWKK
jgi:hypothetical protein